MKLEKPETTHTDSRQPENILTTLFLGLFDKTFALISLLSLIFCLIQGVNLKIRIDEIKEHSSLFVKKLKVITHIQSFIVRIQPKYHKPDLNFTLIGIEVSFFSD